MKLLPHHSINYYITIGQGQQSDADKQTLYSEFSQLKSMFEPQLWIRISCWTKITLRAYSQHNPIYSSNMTYF